MRGKKLKIEKNIKFFLIKIKFFIKRRGKTKKNYKVLEFLVSGIFLRTGQPNKSSWRIYFMLE